MRREIDRTLFEACSHSVLAAMDFLKNFPRR